MIRFSWRMLLRVVMAALGIALWSFVFTFAEQAFTDEITGQNVPTTSSGGSPHSVHHKRKSTTNSGPTTLGAPVNGDLAEFYSQYVLKSIWSVEHIGDGNCLPCLAAANNSLGRSQACTDTYNRLYKNSTVNMSIFFGYSDATPDTDDGFEAAALIQAITSPCTPYSSLCGFALSDNGDYTKQVLGPDGNYKTIDLNIEHASVDHNNAVNTGPGLAAQMVQSQRVRNDFDKAMQNSDVVFYDGHAREGGGPDFFPVKFKYEADEKAWAVPPANGFNSADDQAAWEKAHQPGFTEMKTDLSSTGTPPKVVGVFACDAANHFEAGLKSASATTAYVLSDDHVEWPDQVFYEMLGTLESIVSMRCEQGFNSSLDRALDPARGSRPVVDNFFRAGPPDATAQPPVNADDPGYLPTGSAGAQMSAGPGVGQFGTGIPAIIAPTTSSPPAVLAPATGYSNQLAPPAPLAPPPAPQNLNNAVGGVY